MTNCLSAFALDTSARKKKDAEKLAPEISLSSAESYLMDESHLQGKAEHIFIPRSEADIISILQSARETATPITLSGGRTGVTGGAVPMGGWLISLSQMNNMLGLRFIADQNRFLLRCQPGASLESINTAIAGKAFPGEDNWSAEAQSALKMFRESGSYIFPPDPTEKSATLGGMVACNASGACTLYYGSTRNYVSALRIVLIDGTLLSLKRGECYADDRQFRLVLPDGVVRNGLIPRYDMPNVKNAAGYFSRSGMDLLDLFIGSEGTLGIFSEIEIMLIPAPEIILGVIAFFPSESKALTFVRAARGEHISGIEKCELIKQPLALEFFDYHALNLLRDQKRIDGSSSSIPALLPSAHTAVYIELATSENKLDDTAEALMALLESCSSQSETAWTAITPEENVRLQEFRHAVPEIINQRIGERTRTSPGITKLGTDFAVPDEALFKVMTLYHEILDEKNLEYVIFGHIGNNHLHVNILPRSQQEYQKGKTIYLNMAKRVVSYGGTVSAEHGIGKLKKPFLQLMIGDAGIADMRKVKQVFDPEGRLNPGNIF